MQLLHKLPRSHPILHIQIEILTSSSSTAPRLRARCIVHLSMEITRQRVIAAMAGTL